MKEEMIARFWKHVARRGDKDCWEWKGAVAGQGYGYLFSHMLPGTKKPRNVYAHRFAWQVHFGAIPKGMLVCHHCDNPACVNPAHLFLGSQCDNMQDMVHKGRKANVGEAIRAAWAQRWSKKRAEREKREKRVRGGFSIKTYSKLTCDQVAEIRRLAEQGLAHKSIAAQFGVDYTTVRKIIQGKTWKWLISTDKI